MANHAQGPAGEPALQGDAGVLYRAMRQCISTSPDAFSMTRAELERKPTDYWHREVSTATWAVIETRTEVTEVLEVIGIAVARRPDPQADTDVNPHRARFIESAWISPDYRRTRRGKRLMRFLFGEERRRHPQVDEFWLWVFEENETAIRFYKRLGFEYTGVSKKHEPSGRRELRYRYSWNSAQAGEHTPANETYRILKIG